MIAFVRGTVAEVGLSSVVVDVGGVGYEVQCAPDTLASLRIGQEATVPTSMVVREDSMTLFGFADADERQMFELLQTASGVGPKVAQSMLAVHRPDAIRTAVSGEDVKALTAVPGIGQKGAQRIILELKDRIGVPTGTTSTPAPAAAAPAWRDQVADGLVNLGYSAKDADKAVAAVADSEPSTTDIGALLRAALQTLRKV